MQSNFSATCKNARELITVPTAPLNVIRSAAACRPIPQSGKHRKGLIAALLTGASIVAVAAGAQVMSFSHISFNRSGEMEIRFSPGNGTPPIKNPTRSDLDSAARQANFPVVFPTGLPGNAPPTILMSGPDVLLLQYNLPGASRRSDHLLTLLLANPRTLTAATQDARAKYKLLMPSARGGTRWLVGHEEVILMRSTLTPTELAHLKSAMYAKSHLDPAR
ncbi:MAG: hypothetical protein M3Y21_11165 [Candidatus Eremiobacteraeota bacterium]|nr:hypothetical protein [Candidatus Eremiobacteraeota bacterium]